LKGTLTIELRVTVGLIPDQGDIRKAELVRLGDEVVESFLRLLKWHSKGKKGKNHEYL
jgi:hypothetical protein